MLYSSCTHMATVVVEGLKAGAVVIISTFRRRNERARAAQSAVCVQFSTVVGRGCSLLDAELAAAVTGTPSRRQSVNRPIDRQLLPLYEVLARPIYHLPITTICRRPAHRVRFNVNTSLASYIRGAGKVLLINYVAFPREPH